MKFNKGLTVISSPLEGLEAYYKAFVEGKLSRVPLYPSVQDRHDGVWEKFSLQEFSWKDDRDKEPLEIAAFHLLPRGLVVDELTRHRDTDQLFIPVTGSLMAVAGPSLEADGEHPDPLLLTLIPIQPGEAIKIRAGTWHTLPFAMVHDVICLSVIRREEMNNYHDLRDLASLGWVGIPTWSDPKHE